MIRIVALAAVALLIGCYSNNAAVKAKLMPHGTDPDHPLYVGHSDRGEIVVAATHYDAMSGLAVTADEVGQKRKEGMICRREMVTGTHLPQWTCRFNKEVSEEAAATQDFLNRPRACLYRCAGTSK